MSSVLGSADAKLLQEAHLGQAVRQKQPLCKSTSWKCRKFVQRKRAPSLRLNCTRAFRRGGKRRKQQQDHPEQGQPKGRRAAEIARMASRMLCGRTLAVHQELMSTSLFKPCDPKKELKPELRPAAGLTAWYGQEPILIVHTFQRRGKWMAHIVPIIRSVAKHAPQGAEAVLNRRRACTCTCSELREVGLQWQVVGYAHDSVYLKRFKASMSKVWCVQDVLESWEGLSEAASACLDLPMWAQEEQGVPFDPSGAIEVLSLDAVQHLRDHPHHRLVPRERIYDPTFLLDVPVPKLLDMRHRRCVSCAALGVAVDFKPGPDDVARCLPDIVVHQGSAHSKKYRFITSTFLLWLLKGVYETFNLRSVRRRLAESASTCALSQIVRGKCQFSPTSVGALVLALPTGEELRAIALKAFSNFVEAQANMLVKRQAIYNMSIVRGDGHYDLAARVFQVDPDSVTGQQRPYTCILAWCGTDGSLLKPWVLKPGESFEDQVTDLEPFLQTAKEIRMGFGMSWAESRPTAHATDTYNKHRQLWARVYDRVWCGQEVGFGSRTAKGDVCNIARCPENQGLDTTLITGEPFHDIINLRRALPNLGQDFADIYFDHTVPRMLKDSILLLNIFFFFQY